MASATGSPSSMPETEAVEANGRAGRPRRRMRYRRRLRSRIILGFVLLGFGLTALFAFATNWTRNRVENQLVEDVMNRNIDEYARQYFSNPEEKPEIQVQQMYARMVGPDRFEALRLEEPDWYELPDGIHSIKGTEPDGSPFSYKLAVRKTPEAWFFLAYDMTQAARGEAQFNRAIFGSVLVFTLL